MSIIRVPIPNTVPKVLSTSQAITSSDVINYPGVTITGSHITVTMPDPDANSGNKFLYFTNETAYESYLYSAAGFVGANYAYTLPAYTTVMALCRKQSDSSYLWMIFADKKSEYAWKTWTPTVVYAGGTDPTGSLAWVCRYRVKDGICHISLKGSSTDGNGTTSITISPPFWPNDLNVDIPMIGHKVVDGTASKVLAYLDCTDNTPENRLIKFRTLGTLTDNKAWSVEVSGFFPLGDTWKTCANVLTQTGGPTTLTEVYQYQLSDGICYGIYQATATDGNGTSAATLAPPLVVPDINCKLAMAAHEKVDTTWSDPSGYLDAITDTGADRLLKFNNFTTFTAAGTVACALAIAFAFPIEGGTAWTPTNTFTTATPATLTNVGRYHVANGLLWLGVYQSSADGNGATNLQITNPPLVAKYAARGIRLNAQELVNATYTNIGAYLNASDADVADRTIVFQNFATATDSQAYALLMSGFAEVES